MKNKFKSIFIPGTIKSVLGIGTTTTIGYGTIYYSFTIMSTQIQNEFGWSKSFLFAIFSLGILLGGFLAPTVGKLLDHHGARIIMTVGSFLCFLGLYGISFIETQWQYIVAILFLEIVSTLVLYESAFVAFSQLVGNNARTPITQITLIAGFASTIFWPLISYLLTIMHWRDVYLTLGLFHILLAMPIHYFVLKSNLLIDNESKENTMASLPTTLSLQNSERKEAKWYLIFVFSLIAIPVTVMQTHFMGLLAEFGFEMATAVLLGTIIGPAQVIARIFEIAFAKKITPLQSGYYSILVLCVGLVALIFSGYSYYFALLFVILYGAGQGLVAVIRGSIPLYLFGKKGYGKMNGNINLYRNIVVATVPFGFAVILDVFGAHIGVLMLAIVSFISLVLLYILMNKMKGY